MSGSTNGYQRGRGFGSGHGAPPERMIPIPSMHFADVPQEYIQKLKSSWTLLKKSENVRQMLLSYLETSENPYAVALEIASGCEDLFHNKTNSLAGFVIEEFCAWSKLHEQKILHNLTSELKYKAFCLITMQKNHSLTKAIIDAYKMAEEKMLFVDKIRDFVRFKKYKEACQCAVALDLINQFAIEDIILPLIFQDKISVAEEALANNHGLQVELVARLDELVGERSLRNTVEYLINRLEVPDVKMERFVNHKPLGRLIAKLVKTYNLPADSTPNLNQKRSAGALHYLFAKRFFEKTLSIDSWKEMAFDAVKGNSTLQTELVSMLNNYNEVEEALYWAIEFNVPQQQWPYNVHEKFRENPLVKHEFPKPSGSDDHEPEDWSDNNEYHTLELPDSAIQMVDSEELLKECFAYINNHHCKMVGIDSEWKPAFGAQQNELALIQLATWDRIFILDVIGLLGICPSFWHQAAQLFFENPDILKLGFSLGSDMVMIKSAIAPLANLKLNGSGYLDLSQVWRRLQNRGLTFPYSGENTNSGGESLSRLVSLCLGRSLNKSDQFSNWEQRPLRTGQKRYAALDAFCLLELHRTIQKLSEDQGLPFLEVCDELIMGFRSPKKNLVPAGGRRGRGRGRRPPGSNPNPGQGPSQGQEDGAEGTEAGGSSARPADTPQGVGSVRFAADLMLCGLGRQLRKCGVDCMILEHTTRRQPQQEADSILRRIVGEQRVVLSQGGNLQWFQSQLCDVFRVKSAAACDQLSEVLDHFNIVVKETDVFTRCQRCNSNAFEKASRETMLCLAGVPAVVPAGEPAAHGVECVTTGDLQERVAAMSFAMKMASAAAGTGSGDQLPEHEDTLCPTPDSEHPETPRSRVLCDESACIKDGLTHLGARIAVKDVPVGVLKKVQFFYVCSICGKVYWDGSHLGRAIERFKVRGVNLMVGDLCDNGQDCGTQADQAT